jgi:integrase/recombinase XerD
VDFENRRITVRPKDFWKPKGKEERIIPMHDVVFYLLLRLERRGRWAFTKADGGQANIHLLETKFRRRLKRLGIANANLHTWRHSFASYLIMKSGNIRAVQKLLGHKSIRTTEVYTHFSEKHLHHVVGQLPGQEMGAFLGANAVLQSRAMALR